VAAACALVAYSLAYLALARAGLTFQIGNAWSCSPDYFGVPQAAFRPIHTLDRLHLRPQKWAGVQPPLTPADLGQLGETGFDWYVGTNMIHHQAGEQ
jgi:hypothetical protein